MIRIVEKVSGLMFVVLFGLLFATKVSAQVVINEVFPNPFGSSESSEFVEIFNSGNEAVVITGWKLSDIGGVTKVYIFPEATLEPGVYANFPKPVTGITLNNDSDGVELKDSMGVLKDSMSYSQTIEGRSWSRIPNGSGNFVNNTEPSELASNISPTVTSPTPTPSPSPTQTASKAIYKLDKPKDNSGSELTSVQIFVDGKYIHHEDDELLEFYSGNECYPGVSCSFGTHAISLRKNGYSNWEDARDFQVGMNLEVTPILNKQNITTAAPTPTPTPTPTKTPTPSAAPKATPSPTENSEETISTKSGSVLGLKLPSSNPTPTAVPDTINKSQTLPFLLMAGGVTLIGISVFLAIKTNKTSQIQNDI